MAPIPQNCRPVSRPAARTIRPETSWDDNGIPDSWKRHWFDRIKDLVDQYQPDLLYTDGAAAVRGIRASAWWRTSTTSAPRGTAAKWRRSTPASGGRTARTAPACSTWSAAWPTQILPNPWQTDTCVGNWHYQRDIKYKTPKTVIDMLVDIVSRNGNLLLNFPLPNSGALDPEELKIVAGITRWMAVNSEGIYATRPWKIFGEGPGTQVAREGRVQRERHAKR